MSEAVEDEPERDDCLEWWSVTDDELKENLANIQKIPKEGFKELSVHGYQQDTLCHVPQLGSPFQTLTLLDLRWNKITELTVTDLSVNLEVIIMSHNELQKVPALNQLARLKELDLSNNQLMAVDPSIPETIEIINLSNNNIQVFPPLDKHVHLHQLFLGYNYIHHLSSNQLPSNVETLDLSHNYLHAAPHLGLLHRLKHCNLSYNKLKQLHPEFPATLEVLDVSFNNIQIVPSLADTSLKHLNLTDNIVVRLLGFPATLQALLLVDVTSLKVLPEECFPCQAVYDVIKRSLQFSQVFNLAQPAPHVFNQGYQHLKRYFTGKFTCNSRNRIVLTGEPESGKTSLARTLNKGRPTMTHALERTMFMKITTWKVDEETSFRIYDHGGYDTDTIINHMFVSNKSNVLLCHDLNNRGEVSRSIDHLHHMLKLQPENHFHFVLTHVDKLYTQVYFESLNQLKKAVSLFWSEEIRELKSKMDVNNKPQIQKMITLYQQKKESLKYFPVSCKTNKGIQDLKDYLIKSTDENRVLIPHHWLHVYTSLKETNAEFLTFFHIENVLRNLSDMSECDAETIKGNTEDCLSYFNDLDILVWHQSLRDYVFHNLGFLIDIFAQLFQGDVEGNLRKNFEQSETFQDMLTEDESESMLSLYRKGLLQKGLICFLWRKNHLSSEETDALIEVMKSFNLLYPISSGSELHYCPWMVTNQQPPDGFSLDNPAVIDSKHVTLHLECQFFNGIPSHVSKMWCVCLQRHAVKNNYKGERYSWKEGLMVTLRENRCFVYRNKWAGTLSCVVQCPTEGIFTAWETLSCLYEDLKKILALWRGLLMTAYFVCAHCGIICLKHPYKWPTHVVWPQVPDGKACTDHVMCPHDLGEDVPTGLIQFVKHDSPSQVETITEYLKENWVDFGAGLELSEGVKYHLRSKLPQFQAIMCVDPVIRGLHQAKLISDRYKDKLETLNSPAKVESLLKKVVLRRTREDMAQFRQVLLETGYHTNVTLAKLVPHGEGVPSDPVELLTKAEHKVIKEKFYKVLSDDIGVERLIPHLHNTGAIHETQHKAVIDKVTSQGKAGYLLDQVLLRGTYQTVHKFRKALLKSNSKYLASLLPTRTGDTGYVDSDESDLSEIELDEEDSNTGGDKFKNQHSNNTEGDRNKPQHSANKRSRKGASKLQYPSGGDRDNQPEPSVVRSTEDSARSKSTTRGQHGPSRNPTGDSFQAYEGQVKNKSKFCVIS